MAKLRIPPNQRAAVLALSHMPSAEANALAADLKGADVSLRGVQAVVADHFETNTEEIASALVSLAMVTATTDATAREVDADIRETLRGDAGQVDLAPLLESPTLVALTKTIDLRTAHERILQDFRVFTDIRPVFASDIDEPIGSAIVTHIARVTYGTSNGVEERFVSLTHRDLIDIRDVVERALAKEQRAHDFIESRGGRVLDSFKEDE